MLATIALEHADALLQRNADIARANLAAVSEVVRRSTGLFRWDRPRAGLVAWLKWSGPGSASELARALLADDSLLVADHSLFGLEDSPTGGGLRLGLGPVDMPARLGRFERAAARYASEKGWRGTAGESAE